MTTCVFPGSFDPVTKGHLDLIGRASSLFDQVTVTVMINIHKSGLFSVQQRIQLLQKACLPYHNVRIDSWNGLLSEYMRLKDEQIIIRGIRSGAETEQELPAALANRMLNNRIETIFMPSAPELAGVSSSAVREILSFGGDIHAFVPESIAEDITALLSK